MRTNSKARSKSKIRVADYIASFLVEKGVKDLFVLTGYGAMYLNDAIAAHPTLKYYCVRNEATSPMMAEAYARIKQVPAAVCLTAGPGSTNAVPGLAEAWVDSAPIIVISGQVHRDHTTYKANISGLRTFGTAEINIIPIVKPLTKYAQEVSNPNLIRYYLEKAFYLATAGRPGPVWLDVPLDIQYAHVDPKSLKGFVPPKLHKNMRLEGQIERLIKFLNRSKRPLIVAGQGIKQAGASRQFKNLARLINAPVILTRLGLDLLPYSHPNNMGLGGIKGSRYCVSVMKKADLVICLGARLAIPFVGSKLDMFDTRAKIVAVDIEKAELEKPGVKIDLPIHDNVLDFLNKLSDRLSQEKIKKSRQWLQHCQKLKRDNPMVIPQMRRNPIDLYYFMSRLDEISSKNNILVTDAGSNYYVGGQVFRFEKGQKEVTSATFAAMGLSIPLAIGAAVAKPRTKVLAVTGDGSLELNMQELKTMSYYNLNIKLFVINNGGYVSIRNWQDTFFGGRHIGSDDKTGAETLNLKKVAEAFDLNYECINQWEEIDTKLKQITSVDGPVFVEVVCDNRQRIIEPIKNKGSGSYG